jgi:hypothetical protein
MRIDSESVPSDKENRICEGLRVIFQYTGGGQKDYISQITEITKFKKIIKYFFSVSPVCSAREIYSAMHNIMEMKKSEKRLTVNRER